MQCQFTSYAESLKFYNSYFVLCTMHTKWTHLFLFHFLMRSHSPTHYLWLLKCKDGQKRSGTMGSSSFPLFFLVLDVSGWLKQRRNTHKKEYDTVPCLLVFLRIPFAFSLHLMQSQFWTQCMASGRYQGSLLPSHQPKTITFRFVWNHLHRGFTRDVCWGGIWGAMYDRWAETHILWQSL